MALVEREREETFQGSGAAVAAAARLLRTWARPIGLFILASLSLLGYIVIRPLSFGALAHPAGVAIAELALAIPYALACWWVIAGP